MRKISFCLTSFNRFDSIVKIINTISPHVDEVVISDDHSNIEIFNQLNSFTKNFNNVFLYRNEFNVGAFHNKHIVLEKAKNDWCVLFDSDNQIEKKYIDILHTIEKWDEKTIYSPSNFGTKNFSEYNNKKFNDVKSLIFDDDGTANNNAWLFNTGNYFLNRKKYIEVSEKWKDIIKYVEVISFCFLWFKNGGNFMVVPHLKYNHIRSKDSFYLAQISKHKKMTDYIKNCIIKNEDFNKDIITKTINK